MRRRLFGNGGGANIDQIISSIALQFSSEGYEKVYWNYSIQDYSYRIYTEDYTSTGQLYTFQDSHSSQITIEQYGRQLTGSSPLMKITVFYNDADQLEEIGSTYDNRVVSLEVENNPDSFVPNLSLAFSAYVPGSYQLGTLFSISLRVNGDNDNPIYITGTIL